jgi:tetratricopeptide (TPR) repeat protein
MSVNRISEFNSKLENFEHTWASIETKVLAGKVEDRWINLGTIIKLSSHERAEEEKQLFHLENRIIILKKVEKFSFDNFKSTIGNLSKSLNIGKIEIISEGFGDFNYITKEKENWIEDRITDTERWPAYILRCYGKNPQELLKNIDEIEESLRANIEPYEDLVDLSSTFVLPVGGPYIIGIYVIAPIYVGFEKLALSTTGNLEIRIKLHKSIEIENLKLNVILTPSSIGSDRFQLSFKQKARAEGEFLVVDQLVERNLTGIKGARIYLFYKDNLIRTDWVTAIRPSTEEELRKDISNTIQRMRESASYIESILEEIEIAMLNGILDIGDNVKDKSVWNDLGLYCMENGFYRQAELIYGRMIDTITKYEKMKGRRLHKGLAFHNLGVALLYQNRRDEAKKMFERAYEEDRLSYGVVNAEQMQAREALKKFFAE